MSGQTHGGKGDRPRVIEDRTQYESNWDKIFGVEGNEVSSDPVEPINTTENFARKMREWNMMYDCLQNIHLYEYPIEEVKELLKRIKV
jgi:hypothetical protein